MTFSILKVADPWGIVEKRLPLQRHFLVSCENNWLNFKVVGVEVEDIAFYQNSTLTPASICLPSSDSDSKLCYKIYVTPTPPRANLTVLRLHSRDYEAQITVGFV